MPQVCLYPKDVAQLTGTGYDAGKRLLQRIRTKLRKPARAYVSAAEFCAYTRLPEAEVAAALHGTSAPVNRSCRHSAGTMKPVNGNLASD